jgi:ADP-heptose:LPS heptosyltransferase
MKGELPMIPRYKIWANAAGVSPSTYAPVYKIEKSELEWAQDYAKRWKGKINVALGTTACDPKRGIGIGKITEICQRLIEKGFNPITVDATFHFEGVDYVIGKRIREVIALLTQMDAVISVDSGVLHMAGVAQQTATVPIVGIFGSTDYRMRMGPYYGSAIDSSKLVDCAPCWYKFDCLRSPNPSEHLKCLSRSTAEFIVEETCRWLAKVGKFSMV